MAGRRSGRGGRRRPSGSGREGDRGRSSGRRGGGRSRSRKASGDGAPRPRAPRGPRVIAHRLDPDVRPIAYEIELDVDPERERTFRGELAIRLRLAEPRGHIELHAVDLRVARARIEHGGETHRARLEARPERETLEVHTDAPIPAGEATLRIAFGGRLREDLRGLYHVRAGERDYAFTQLEAAEARRFFPCFDEPAMKARFRITVTTAAEHTVISNAPVEREEPAEDGRKTVRFAQTPPLSTYLVALAVGSLEGSEPVEVGVTPVRVWHVPGKGALTGFSLEAARECLARLESYFDLPYPYAKLDLVAVPDFEAGAMENAGAVFFRETLLLLDPAVATTTEKKRAAEVICHELAHMWYGDLVTMAWWDDLWLNEAFATWMAFHVVDHWKPEWKMWQDFQHHRAAALRLDALRHTHPIHTEVRSPIEATQNFDLITYEKGASVVRMVERFLGEETFREGVRTYIRRHKESHARGADLWRALTEAAAGQEVEPIVRAWIEQPGLPMLAVKRSTRRTGALTVQLRQEPFTAYPPALRKRLAARADERPARWPIPWVGRVGEPGGATRLVRHLLTRVQDRVELEAEAADFVYGNADEGGFFRPLHEAEELEALGTHRDRLPAVERMGLVDHQWALTRAGEAPLEEFLGLAERFREEADPDVLLTLRGPLAFLDDRLAPAAGIGVTEHLRAWLRELFAPQLERLGWDAARGEPEDTRRRRTVIVAVLGGLAEDPAVLEEAARRFEAYLEDRSSLDPDLADPVVSLAARTGDGQRYDRMLAVMERADTPQERRRFLLALADFRDRVLIDRTLDLTLTDTVPTQDVAFVLARLLANPAARERAWQFVKRRWTALARRMPPMLVTRLIEATPALGTRQHRRDVAAFFRAHPVPSGERALRQALERFDLDEAFARAASGPLRRWLAGRMEAAA